MRPLHVVADIERSDTSRLLRDGDSFVSEMNRFAIKLDLVILNEAFLLFLGAAAGAIWLIISIIIYDRPKHKKHPHN